MIRLISSRRAPPPTSSSSIEPRPNQDRKRICVIGNSFIGALKKAYESADRPRYDMYFFASPGRDFRKIALQEGMLTNISYSDEASKNISEYDAAVIYGDLPVPQQVLTMRKGIKATNYSDGLRQAHFESWLSRSGAYRLCLALATRADFPVFIISRNTKVSESVPPGKQYDDGVNLISELVRPAMYIAAPRPLFSAEGKPLPKFYSGSLNILGNEPDRDRHPLHQLAHLNEEGGSLMLAAIIDRLSAHFSS